jgi:hypothetical protein
MGLYQDNITSETGDAEAAKKPLATMTNVDLEHRRKDFGSQFEMMDDSPAPSARTGGTPAEQAQPSSQQQQQQNQQKADQNLAKVIKGLDASWDMYDDIPDPVSKKENVPRSRGTGESMGRKENNMRHWGFGDDDV